MKINKLIYVQVKHTNVTSNWNAGFKEEPIIKPPLIQV